MDQEVKCEEPKSTEEQKAPEGPKTDEKPKTPEELRRSPRLQCSGTAGIQTLPACDKPVPAKIIDLSIGGCLMEFESPKELAIDEIVELIFNVNHMPFRVRGKVRMIHSRTLMGFQFPQLSDRIRMQLEDLVGELIERLAKLHQESLANRPVDDDGKQPHVALPARGAAPLHPIRPVEVRPGNAAARPEPHRRWF
ncbi:MAG: PilZ domain-containing protein [Terracidiphilus sp.]|jgi:hypothetical protein